MDRNGIYKGWSEIHKYKQHSAWSNIQYMQTLDHNWILQFISNEWYYSYMMLPLSLLYNRNNTNETLILLWHTIIQTET